jgi:hypothetical protein
LSFAGLKTSDKIFAEAAQEACRQSPHLHCAIGLLKATREGYELGYGEEEFEEDCDTLTMEYMVDANGVNVTNVVPEIREQGTGCKVALFALEFVVVTFYFRNRLCTRKYIR